MKKITQEKFFEELKKDNRDIMPHIIGKYPYISEWRTNDSDRIVFGISKENEYFLTDAIAQAEGK